MKKFVFDDCSFCNFFENEYYLCRDNSQVCCMLARKIIMKEGKFLFPKDCPLPDTDEIPTYDIPEIIKVIKQRSQEGEEFWALQDHEKGTTEIYFEEK